VGAAETCPARVGVSLRSMFTCTRFNLFENNHFTEMCSGSEAGSYLRLIDFVSLNSRLESNKEEEDVHLHPFQSIQLSGF